MKKNKLLSNEKIKEYFVSDSIIKKNYIWNTIAGIINAGEAVILSVLITRISGLEDAGILTISFAVSNLYSTIGKFGMRNFQVTDSDNVQFEKYFYARKVTIIIMIVVSILHCVSGIVLNDYSVYKALIMLFMCLIFAIEALEDVYWGEFQKRGFLYQGAKNFIYRWCGIFITYFIVMFCTKNLLIATFSALLISLFIFVIRKNITFGKEKLLKQNGVFELLRSCLPLCLVSFLNFYICNAPKYAIDKYMSDEIQACFGFVAMPVFVVGLLSSFLYQPILVDISLDWKERRYTEFKKKIRKQQSLILGILIVCLVGAYLLGIPVLSFLFHTGLGKYRYELMLIVLASGSLALANLYDVVITIMRKQKYILFNYGICALSAVFFLPIAVMKYGTKGAAFAYLIILILLAVLEKITTLLIINNSVSLNKKNSQK